MYCMYLEIQLNLVNVWNVKETAVDKSNFEPMHINGGCMNRKPISREKQESINFQPLLCKVGNTERDFISKKTTI